MSNQLPARPKMTIQEGIDETWGKFRAFVMDTLLALKLPKDKIDFVREVTGQHSLVYLPKIRGFCTQYKAMILGREKDFFRAYLRQQLSENAPEWKDTEIPDKILEKGLEFGFVFLSLISQLEK